MSIYIIDAECVYINEKLYPKEVALIDYHNPLELSYFLILPPVAWEHLSNDDRKRNAYLLTNFHQLSFNCGYHTINDVIQAIKADSLVFVQGAEKCKMFTELFTNYHTSSSIFVSNNNNNNIHFSDLKFPSIPALPLQYKHITCPYHANETDSGQHLNRCAAIKIYKLYSYMKAKRSM